MAHSVVRAAAITGRAVVEIPAKMCQEVGPLRGIAGAISSLIDGLALFGQSADRYTGLSKACASFNKAMGGISIVSRLSFFTTDRAFDNILVTMSKVMFVVKDFLSFHTFLQGLSIISGSTANYVFSKASDICGGVVTAKSVASTFDYMGWGLDAANNLAEWHRDWKQDGWDSLSWKRGFALSTDVFKLTAITLASGTTFWAQAIRYGALFGVGAVGIARATHSYIQNR